VSSSDSTKTVYVTTGTAYTAVGGELSANEKGSLAYVSSAWKLSVDKNYVSCSIYNIAGNNYFKLRDLGGAIGFTVGYDKAANCVLITTGSSGTVYSPDMTFSTTDTAGRTVTDSVFKSQKLTMINYWAYWCGPCCGELPDLQKLSVNYASKGLRVIGVFDSAEASDDIAKLNELGITYTNLNYVSAFDKYLNTGYLPTTVFVDQNGKVVSESYIGSKSYSDWSAIVDGLLK
jgi:thiol-disulfide isomerase/thioredoxin